METLGIAGPWAEPTAQLSNCTPENCRPVTQRLLIVMFWARRDADDVCNRIPEDPTTGQPEGPVDESVPLPLMGYADGLSLDMVTPCADSI
jgi:hypothetical protein